VDKWCAIDTESNSVDAISGFRGEKSRNICTRIHDIVNPEVSME
jgi:hypothetical protein